MEKATTGAFASGSTTLYFGPWYRRSPFFEATLRDGCTAYDIYNHMYLPGYFDDIVKEYWALVNDVVIYDVGVERTVEVSGPDADHLIDQISCRDMTKCQIKQGKYMIVTARDGGIVNDPVLLHVAEDRWWMQLADSDAGLYALGVATALGLDVEVTYPEVYPMQVQGPSSAKTLAKLVGPAIYDLKYYWCDWFEIAGIPVVISRTGFTAVPGFEVNILDASRGTELWDAILGAGEEFSIRPAIPSMIRRLEAGIFNYGSDMTLENNPFELMGMERLVEEQSQPYIGKDALERIRREGVSRKLVGIEIDGDELTFDPTGFWPVHSDGKEVGKVTDAVWSPRLEKNIGYVWVPIELAGPGNRLDIESEQGHLSGQTAAIPFVDPKKEVPAGTLRS
ncbi:MAG: glycine cleavage system protein T [Actinomycetota bacterium]|nr:glycine cleavage system protein T [Actinomycetota bacterium]